MRDKRGQVTIFIIIAIIIVVLAVLIFLFYPEIKHTLGIGDENPNSFMQNCLDREIEDAVEILAPQGGSLNPEHYYMYQDQKIEYLCYTGEFYETCTMQQPMLKRHIENEIKDYIDDTARECLDSLETSLENDGYIVNLNRGGYSVELLPKRIVVIFNTSLSLIRGEDSSSTGSLNIGITNNMYELVSISNSILNWEARYGDAETTTYMNYYHDLKVEKLLQSDGTTIYILTDRNNGNMFQFASRSVAWPPGYGSQHILIPTER